MRASGQSLTTLYSFTGGVDSGNPWAGVIMDGSGNIYGANNGDKTGGWGALFSFAPPYGLANESTLFTFTLGSSAGVNPTSTPAFDASGNLWGAAAGGGPDGSARGAIYKLNQPFSSSTPIGVFEFDDSHYQDGSNPYGKPFFDANGNMYGTTACGGSGTYNSGFGTVFRITPSGSFDVLYTFSGGADGGEPVGGVLVDGNGTIYGTTAGGVYNSGGVSTSVVFKLSPPYGQGSETVLHTFATSDGGTGPLTLGTDGALYGCTLAGGSDGYGAVYRVTPAGQFTTLYSFSGGVDGSSPEGILAVGKDGNLYGTARYGGAYSNGTIFCLTEAGAFAPLYSFGSNTGDGAQPTGGVTQASDGSFYGTTSAGGAYGHGSIFRFRANTVLSSLTLSPQQVTGGATSTGTVTISLPAPTGGLSVALSSNGTSASVPSSVTVPAGSTTATFTVTTTTVAKATSAVISATAGASTQSAMLSINPPALQSVVVTPAALYGGASATCTVTLNGAAPAGGYLVALSSSSSSATLPATVLVMVKNTVATAKVTTTPVATATTVTITGTYGGASQQGTFTINPPALTGLSLNPTSVIGGTSSTGTVTLNTAAPTGGLTISLSSNSTSAVAPATVTVAAGATSGTFTITTSPVSTNTTAVITASFGSATYKPSLLIKPAILSTVSVSPASVIGGSSTVVTGTVTLGSAAGPSGLVITLASSSSSAKVPASVKVAAGATTATFTVTTSQVAAATTATLTATLSGASVTTTLSVNPYQVATLSVSPTSVTGGMTTTCTVTLNAPAPAGGTTVSLSSNSSSLSVPASIVVPAGSSTAIFSATSSPIATSTTATVQSWVGSSSSAGQSASVTVTPPSIVNVLFVPPSVAQGTSTTLYVILKGLAPAGATLQVSSNSTRLTVGTSLAMVAGQAAQTFTLPTTAGSPTTVTITVTYNGGSQSSTLTITP